MRDRRKRRAGLLTGRLYAVVLLLGGTAVAAAAEPLSLDAIAALRADRAAPPAILARLRAAGRSFELDEAARQRLGELGFSQRQVEAVAKARLVNPAAGVDPEPAAGPGAIDRTPADEALLQRQEAVIKRAVELAPGMTIVDTGHCRLVLGSGVPPTIAEDVRRLEGLVGRSFPPAFLAAVDRRGVNVAICSGESEYAGWIKALATGLEEAGYQIAAGEMSFEDRARRSPSISVDGITSLRLAGRPPEESRRNVTHAFGFHSLEQLTRGGCGDALQGGFANVTEAMLFGSPALTVNGGYAERELGGGGGAWLQEVRMRLAGGQASGIPELLAGSFAVMEFPQYAECWSFVSLLCAQPEKFLRLVRELRQGAAPLAAITEVYEADAVSLANGWKGAALRQP